jgi:hypothetical protein
MSSAVSYNYHTNELQQQLNQRTWNALLEGTHATNSPHEWVSDRRGFSANPTAHLRLVQRLQGTKLSLPPHYPQDVPLEPTRLATREIHFAHRVFRDYFAEQTQSANHCN